MTEYNGMTHGLYPIDIHQIAAPELHEHENLPALYTPCVAIMILLR